MQSNINLVDSSSSSESSANPPPASTTSSVFNFLRQTVKDHGFVIFNGFWDGASKFINNGFWIAQIIDLIGNFNEEEDKYFADMSFPGFMTGLLLSLLFTSGSLYAHFILNSNPTHAAKKVSYAEEEHIHEFDPRIQPNWIQSILLWLDAVSHTGDGAGTGLLIFSLATANSTPVRADKITALILSTIGGAISAKANTKTCWHNMRLHNKGSLLNSQQTTALTPVIVLNFMISGMRKYHSSFPHHFSPSTTEYWETVIESMTTAKTKMEDAIQFPRRHGAFFRFRKDPESTELTLTPNGINYNT